MNFRTKLSLLGICLNGLVTLIQIPGLIYTVANFIIYIASYFINQGKPLTLIEIEILHFVSFGIICLSVIPGVWLSHKYPPKIVALIGSFLAAISHLCVAFSESPTIIILFYGIVFGLSLGLTIPGNMSLLFKTLPDNPGLASGINSGLIGAGSLVFNFIGTLVINPYDYPADRPANGIKIFDERISDRMPLMFEVISYVCFGIIIVCVFLIQNHAPEAEGKSKQITFRKTFRSREFWILFISFSTTTIGPVYIVQKYKDIAIHLQIMGDQTLAALGSIGALLSSFCRVVFGHMNDKYGFKLVYTLMIIQILIVGVGINFGSDIKSVFAFYICLSYVSLGGHNTLLAPICRKLYGKIVGMKVWGVLSMNSGVGSLLAFIAQVAEPDIGEYAFLITLLSGFSIIALFGMLIFREIPIYEKENEIPLLEKDSSRVLT